MRKKLEERKVIYLSHTSLPGEKVEGGRERGGEVGKRLWREGGENISSFSRVERERRRERGVANVFF